MSKPHILSEAEISTALSALPDWRYAAPNIEAEFTFATFRDAIAFIVQVAIEAEVVNHHPDLRNVYNRVAFALCTHDVGRKVTDADIALAENISAAAARFPKRE
ncbi:MAG: 4a-hydroxytetrahydrobiopterin dehydratase [Roseiarcus sp.]